MSSINSAESTPNDIVDVYADAVAQTAKSSRASPGKRTPTKDIVTDDDIIQTPDEIYQQKTSVAARDLRNFIHGGGFLQEKGSPTANICDRMYNRIYHIDRFSIEDFFVRLERCRHEGVILHWQERQYAADYSRSGIMLDFDYFQPTKTVQILQRHFDAMIRAVTKILAGAIDFTAVADNGIFQFNAFVIRKPDIVLVEGPKTKEYKDGWHILIPEIQCIKGLKQYLIGQLRNEELLKRVFRGAESTQAYVDAVDMGSIRNPIYFYGSSKQGRPAYVLTNAYEISIDSFDVDGEGAPIIDCRQIPVEDLLKGVVKTERGTFNINLTYELSLCTALETIGGSRTWLRKRGFDYKISLETTVQLLVERQDKSISMEELEETSNDVNILTACDPRARYVRGLLDILDISYATSYEKWFKVICAIAHTSHQYAVLAKSFSQRRPESYTSAEFERVWAEATRATTHSAPVTLRSIIHWAQESSPERFRELRKNNYVDRLTQYVYAYEGVIEHAKFADIVYDLACEKFVVDQCVNPLTGKWQYTWFEFIMAGQAMKYGEIWKWRMDVLKPDNIHLLITGPLERIAQDVCNHLREIRDQADEAKAKFLTLTLKAFKRSITKLSNDGFQNSIVSQAQYRFQRSNRGFATELDSYEDVIGTGNGVLRLGAEPRLIRGFHEYKISKYTSVDYVPYDPADPIMQQLEAAVADIFVERDVLEFMLMYFSTGLDNGKSANLFVELFGDGADGKSFLLAMQRNTLGTQYCLSAKPALLTSPSEKAGQTNSSLFLLKGMRFFTCEEFNAGDSYNEAALKSITDGVVTCRGVYRANEESFELKCNGIAATNHDLNIQSQDHGFWRRYYKYYTKNKFVANPDPNNPFEKKVDLKYRNLYVFDPHWQQRWLSLLVHWNTVLRVKYSNDVNNIPVPTIARETAKYRIRKDILDRYIVQFYVSSSSAEPTALETVASRYREWYCKNVRPNTLGVDHYCSAMEKSRLKKFITPNNQGIKMLYGHRMLAATDEPLGEGECKLIASEIVAAQSEPIDTRKFAEMSRRDAMATAAAMGAGGSSGGSSGSNTSSEDPFGSKLPDVIQKKADIRTGPSQDDVLAQLLGTTILDAE